MPHNINLYHQSCMLYIYTLITLTSVSQIAIAALAMLIWGRASSL